MLLLLKEKALFAHFLEVRNSPLPFSLSSLQKDRLTGCLGGIPYHRIGGSVRYVPEEVIFFLDGQPVVKPQRHAALVTLKRRGKPSKAESIEAVRLGITVPQLRDRRSENGVRHGV